jgi:hypothetical protein
LQRTLAFSVLRRKEGKEVAELWESDGNCFRAALTEVPSPDSVSVGEVKVSSRKKKYPVP